MYHGMRERIFSFLDNIGLSRLQLLLATLNNYLKQGGHVF